MACQREVLIFVAFFASSVAKIPTMFDLQLVGENAKVAAKSYNSAAEKLPSPGTAAAEAAIGEANAKSAASLEADLAAEAAAEEAALRASCPECAHDYSALCPREWSEASAGVCTAPASYTAPCAAFAYFSAMSTSDKQLFESRCGVCWPCGAAVPAAPPSPNGPVAFMQAESSLGAPEYPTLNLRVQEPADLAYEKAAASATRANRATLVDLELRQLALREQMASKMASVTASIGDLLKATARSGKLENSASFLASKVLPVDAYKIRRSSCVIVSMPYLLMRLFFCLFSLPCLRACLCCSCFVCCDHVDAVPLRNSLYLTESLRGPAQASINVLSKEDVGKMSEEAKYKGMLDQTANILKSVKSDLAQMGSATTGATAFVALRGASEASRSAALRAEVSDLVSRVEAGGRTAKKALAKAIGMVAEPSAKSAILGSGLPAAALKLMGRPSTPAETSGLAGSLITLLTDMPVTSEVSEEKTGSYGHVSVVVPRPSRVYGADAALMQLASGVTPSSI